MSLVLPLFLLAALAVFVVVLVRSYRSRPKLPPKLDVSQSAYEKALRKWQRDYAKGTDKRPDFPHYVDWEAEQTLKLQAAARHLAGRTELVFPLVCLCAKLRT